MNRYYSIYLMCFTVLLTAIDSFGQGGTPALTPNDFTKLVEVLPPSPDAASLGKYGGAGPSINTGAMSLNIPVYEYKSVHLSIPISLSYSTNGFRVDEVPSRAGVAWTLVAGGVVTHTVFGQDDHTAQRLTPPNFAIENRALFDYLKNVTVSSQNQFDSEPDKYSFNFNGHDGEFVLDASLNPVLLTHSNVKIVKDVNRTDWNFQITAGDGVQYFFGGSAATEYTRRYQGGPSCGKASYDTFIPTAYYLTSIVHPNRDTIRFYYNPRTINYRTGISESLFKYSGSYYNQCGGNPYQVPPLMEDQFCSSYMTTQAKILDLITSTSGMRVKFKYSSRSDGNDRLLSRIEIIDPTSLTRIKSFKFEYITSYATTNLNSYSTSDATLRYRYFLERVTEQSADSIFTKKHLFAYNDINGLPPRVSYSQDHYGFFNGKTNLGLIPTPSTLTWQSKFPSATANRSPDYLFARKGLLTKITYPTGGYDSIVYDGNYFYGSVTTEPPSQNFNVSAESHDLGPGVANSSSALLVGFTQEVAVSATCTFIGTPEEVDPAHNKAKIEVLLAGNPVYSSFVLPGEAVNTILNFASGNSYVLKITAYGTGVLGNAMLTYKPGTTTTQNVNSEVGGTTVSKILTKDYLTGVTGIRKFYYRTFPALANSSARVLRSPSYEKYFRVANLCVDNPGAEQGEGYCGHVGYWYYSVYSNTLTNLYATASSAVQYSTVVEGFGENFENGGIEHRFEDTPDVPPQIIRGSAFLGAAYTSYTWKNGRELSTNHFKKQSGTFLSVKKQYNHYAEDTRISSDIKAYTVNQVYVVPCQNDPPHPTELEAYDCMSYAHMQRWTYPDSVRTVHYNDAGQAILTETSFTEYANQYHALPTKITKWGSDGVADIVTMKYPQDITLTGNAETARQALVAKNILSPILEQNALKGATQLLKIKTDYLIFPNGLVLPSVVNAQVGASTSEPRAQFYKYNINGKIIEQGRIDDLKLSYIWGYLGGYPIAQVENSSSDEIAYSSFEGDKGNFSYAGASTSDVTAPTGEKVYSLAAGNIQRASLLSGTTYLLSYYYKTGASVTVSGGTQTEIITIPYKSGWTYTQRKITGTTTVTISGTGSIDELRLYPANSRMTTYTYKLNIGMTSMSDPNNVTTFYRYDSMGRLMSILDHKGKITKTFRYNYKN